MKRIVYKVVYQDDNHSRDDVIPVFARNINSGFRKALGIALRRAYRSEELVSITFHMVTT